MCFSVCLNIYHFTSPTSVMSMHPRVNLSSSWEDMSLYSISTMMKRKGSMKMTYVEGSLVRAAESQISCQAKKCSLKAKHHLKKKI